MQHSALLHVPETKGDLSRQNVSPIFLSDLRSVLVPLTEVPEYWVCSETLLTSGLSHLGVFRDDMISKSLAYGLKVPGSL